MGDRWQTLILTSADGSNDAARLVASLRDHVSELDHCRFDIRTPDAFEMAGISRVDLAVIMPGASHGDSSALRVLVSELAHLNIALMQVAGPEEHAIAQELDVAPLIDPTARPREAASMLLAVLQRQEVIRQMQRELQVAQRFQGGLRGEISRIHEELQLAALVQREFLPNGLPALHGMSFSALWRPANYVSGDIYDVTRLDEDHIGVFIADAVGHGVPAALMTMVIARALPTKDINDRSYRIVPPDEALRRLNTEMIRRQGDTTRFATALYAVIDCRARTVRLAGAGHPPPILYRAGTSPQLIETTGGLLGVFEDETFDAVEFDLQLDDALLMYSDGFEVAFPEDVTGGRSMKLPTKRYLQEFLAISALDTPEQMIREVTRRIDAQPGSLHQTDDLTLICAKAGEVSAPSERPSHKTLGLHGPVPSTA